MAGSDGVGGRQKRGCGAGVAERAVSDNAGSRKRQSSSTVIGCKKSFPTGCEGKSITEMLRIVLICG
jgi:hypothetical protein